jgi:hypothetical protein
VPQKFLPAIVVIQCDKELIAVLGPAGSNALLPCLLVSIDVQVQAMDS